MAKCSAGIKAFIFYSATAHTPSRQAYIKLMTRFIIIKLLLITALNCIGQGVHLVPIDSANFEYIKDSLINRFEGIDENITFDADNYKKCPCVIDSLKGIISYQSSSNLIKRNQCLFLFENNNEYFVRVGQMTKHKNTAGEYIWKFSIQPIKEKTASEYISLINREISKAEIPRFKDVYIVMDGTNFTFGNIKQNKFATTPITNFNDSVEKAIKYSQRIIRKNK